MKLTMTQLKQIIKEELGGPTLQVDDRLYGFLYWLVHESGKDYELDNILYVVQKPWKYEEEFKEYLNKGE